MSKAKKKAILQRFDHLVSKVAKLGENSEGAIIAAEFGTLRSQIIDIDSNSDWRDHLLWLSDIANSPKELAEMCGVSVKTLQRELRKRGVPPLPAGRRKAGTKYPVRITSPDSKPRKS